MTTDFIEAQHPRVASGQFTNKANTKPAEGLSPSSNWAIAAKLATEAKERMYREAVREMRRLAPEGATAAVFELYSEGEGEELFAFQSYVDADGEDIEISTKLYDDLRSLGYGLDAGAERFGFERDQEIFSLPIAEVDDTEKRLEDAVALHANADVSDVPQTIVAVNQAARERIEHLSRTAAGAPFEARQLMFQWGDGDDMSLMAVAGPDGQIAQAGEWDEDAWHEIDWAASHINNPRHAGLFDTAAHGTGHGPFRLDLAG